MFSFNAIYKQKLFSSFAVILTIFLLCQATSGCADEALDVMKSSILPEQLLVPDKTRITLTLPLNNAALSRAAAPIDFSFNTSDAKYAALYVFNAAPVVDPDTISISNILAICHAGATNMASHFWNNLTLRLDSVLANSQFYQCTASSVDLFSLTQKRIFDAADFPNGTYYWAILGYDEYYIMEYSSPVRSFTVGP